MHLSSPTIYKAPAVFLVLNNPETFFRKPTPKLVPVQCVFWCLLCTTNPRSRAFTAMWTLSNKQRCPRCLQGEPSKTAIVWKWRETTTKGFWLSHQKLYFFCCCLFAFGGFNLFKCFSFWGEEFYLIYLFIKGHHSEQIWRVQWHEFLNVWSRRQKQEWDVEKVKCATQLTLMVHSSDTFTPRISTSGYLFFTQKVCCFFSPVHSRW